MLTPPSPLSLSRLPLTTAVSPDTPALTAARRPIRDDFSCVGVRPSAVHPGAGAPSYYTEGLRCLTMRPGNNELAAAGARVGAGCKEAGQRHRQPRHNARGEPRHATPRPGNINHGHAEPSTSQSQATLSDTLQSGMGACSAVHCRVQRAFHWVHPECISGASGRGPHLVHRPLSLRGHAARGWQASWAEGWTAMALAALSWTSVRPVATIYPIIVRKRN